MIKSSFSSVQQDSSCYSESANMRQPRKEQFEGCLIGQCLGDALGAPVEGSARSVGRWMPFL
jgi:hypothetical protein